MIDSSGAGGAGGSGAGGGRGISQPEAIKEREGARPANASILSTTFCDSATLGAFALFPTPSPFVSALSIMREAESLMRRNGEQQRRRGVGGEGLTSV